jgi:hypothetical protein
MRKLFVVLVAVAACGGGVATDNLPAPSEPGADATTTTAPASGELSSATTLLSATTTTPELTTTTARTVTTSPAPTTTAAMGDVPAWIVDLVLADASTSQGIAPAAIGLISAAPVDWPDGSLGCPKPGVDYIQVIVPGYLVVVSADGTVLAYHLDSEGNYKICQGGSFVGSPDA